VNYRRYRHRITVIMNYIMTTVAFLVVIVSLVALLVMGTEDMGSGHKVFANRATSGHVAFTNRGINVQTDTNQDQGCEPAGGTSGITNACTATSGPGSTETSTQTPVTLQSGFCTGNFVTSFFCFSPSGQVQINCVGDIFGVSNCTTDTGIQLTSCTVALAPASSTFKCTRTVTTTVPGTGITQSGGITGG
jgi:hypothetical protein